MIKILILTLLIIQLKISFSTSTNSSLLEDEKDEDFDLIQKSLIGKGSDSNSDNLSILSLDRNSTDKIKQANLIQLIRSQLKKEIRKLKSTITDSIMEEVINYYGKKLELTDVLKNDYEDLNHKYNQISHNLNQLNQNFKTISKNHRNLVDTVRNNMFMAKKEANEAHKLKLMSNNMNSNLKKKSIDAHTSTVENKIINSNDKLKMELLNDLETKYSSLLEQSLADIFVKNLKNENNNTIVNDSRKLSIRHENNSSAHLSTKPITEISKTTTEYEETISSLNKNTIEILPSDCEDIKNKGHYKNGVFKINIQKENKSFNVLCEFEDNYSWTVLQHRHDGSVNFNKNWNSYKIGFGNLNNDGEFWLGLENMHLLTSQHGYILQVVMTDWENEKYIAEYGSFRIGNEKMKFKLELNEYLKNVSTAGDSLGDSLSNGQSHNNMAFSTFDSDNDMRFYDNCAQIFKSGWWFNACFQSNLNGIYYKYSSESNGENQTKINTKLVKKDQNSQLRFLRNGIHWNSIDFYKSLKTTKMRIRRKN